MSTQRRYPDGFDSYGPSPSNPSRYGSITNDGSFKSSPRRMSGNPDRRWSLSVRSLLRRNRRLALSYHAVAEANRGVLRDSKETPRLRRLIDCSRPTRGEGVLSAPDAFSDIELAENLTVMRERLPSRSHQTTTFWADPAWARFSAHLSPNTVTTHIRHRRNRTFRCHRRYTTL